MNLEKNKQQDNPLHSFKKWLHINEVGTGTDSVAHFSLPIGGGNLVTRNFPQFYSVGDHGFGGPIQDLIPRKKRKHKHR